MSTSVSRPFGPAPFVGYEYFLECAINAFIQGDAVISEDGDEIRWPEPDCDPKADRLVGLARCEGRWAPLIEAGTRQ